MMQAKHKMVHMEKRIWADFGFASITKGMIRLSKCLYAMHISHPNSQPGAPLDGRIRRQNKLVGPLQMWANSVGVR